MMPVQLVHRPALLALLLATLSTACATATPAPAGAPAGEAERPAGEAAGSGSPSASAPVTTGAEAGSPGSAGASASGPGNTEGTAAETPAAPAAGEAKPPASTSGDSGYQRIELPGGEGHPFPYTVEVPAGWKIHQVPNSAGLWLGPAEATPGQDARMVFVRISPASLADPAAVAANIRTSDAADPKWSASMVEVREVNGIKGVLVRMDSGEGEAARSTLALKLPLPKTSVDFMASAPLSEFAKLAPGYERILFSVQPRK